MSQEPLGRELQLGESVRWHRVMSRLIEILEKRYSACFQFLPFEESHADWRLLSALIHRKQMVRLNGSCYFPVMHQSQIAGALQLKDANLPTQTLAWIQELVELVAPLANFGEIERDGLIRLEQELELLASPKGLFRLNEIRSKQLSLVNERSVVASPLSQAREDQVQALKQAPCFIEAKRSEQVLRMALQLHEESRNSAFVPFCDLDPEVRKSSDLLNEIHSVSIFLKNPHMLDTLERAAIEVHLKTSCESKSIFWLTTSDLNYADLLRLYSDQASFLRKLSIRVLRSPTKRDREPRGQVWLH